MKWESALSVPWWIIFLGWEKASTPSPGVLHCMEPKLLIIQGKIKHLVQGEAIGARCDIKIVGWKQVQKALWELVVDGVESRTNLLLVADVSNLFIPGYLWGVCKQDQLVA